MRRSVVALSMLSLFWATSMVCSVADPAALYYKLRLAVSLEDLYYVPIAGLLLLFGTGWLAVRLTAERGILVPVAAVSVTLATLAMSVVASLDKDAWIVNPKSLVAGLGASLAVATFLAVASIALPWWLWRRSQTPPTTR